MMGERLAGKKRLFYEICLEDKVPPDHLVRRLDAVLDLSWLVERDIEPHIPVWDKAKRDDGSLSRADFALTQSGHKLFFANVTNPTFDLDAMCHDP